MLTDREHNFVAAELVFFIGGSGTSW